MNSNRDKQLEAVIGRALKLPDADEDGVLQNAGEDAERLTSAVIRTLAPLATWEVPDPPEDLAQRTMARIESLEKTISFEEAAAMEARGAGPRRGGWYFSVRDLVAAAACIILVVGLFVPGYRGARAVVERNACQSNMAGIYAGLSAFAQQNSGQLPSVRLPERENWLPQGRSGTRAGGNARNLFVLLKQGYVDQAKVFICPSRRNDVALNRRDFRELDNFPARANVSYSMQNMAGPYRVTVSMDPNMAIVGDANPLFDGDAVRELLGGPINSDVHGNGEGQNVLYVSGRVVFAQEPTCGVEGDNIWQAGELTRYTGTEVPLYATDSFLVP